MIKTEFMKVLERMPDDCEISIEFFDSGYEALINQPVAGVKIVTIDSLNHWALSLRGMNEG